MQGCGSKNLNADPDPQIFFNADPDKQNFLNTDLDPDPGHYFRSNFLKNYIRIVLSLKM